MNIEVKEQVMFFNSLFYTTLSDIDNKTLHREIKEIKKSSHGENISNVGGWQSDKYSSDKDVKDFPEFFSLLATSQKILTEIYSLWGIKSPVNIQNYWSNVNERNHFNLSHRHPRSLFSAIYYVKCNENSGDVVFDRPDILEDYFSVDSYNEYTFQSYSVPPKESLFLVFPSYISHYVKPNMSGEERVSIAINFS